MASYVRRLLVGVLATASAAVALPGAASASVAGVPDVAPPVLEWGPCEEDRPAPFQCATAAVPLDYEHPHGQTISLALLRHPAQKPEQRIGSLFINPGGPGGSGVDVAFFIQPFMPQELLDRFDLVGFDPRGVARSRQVTCWTGAELDAAFAATRLLPTPPSLSDALTRARSFVDACVQRSGDLLPYIGTEYVARDMDLLRAAVGDKKLTYFGFSFGTFIGTVYANLFPRRVRALALDGAYNPITYSKFPYLYDRGQFIALERSLTHFLAWCSDNPGLCGFGDGDAEGAFDRLVAELDANPVVVGTDAGPGTVNAATLLMNVAFFMNNGMAGWPFLGTLLAEEQANPGGGAFPPFNDTGNADFFAANTAVECADRAFPRSLRVLGRRLAAHARLGKRLGPLFAYGPTSYDHAHATACVQWPAFASDDAPSRYRGGWAARGAPPILVVGTTGDPDTPYPDAVALSRILSRGMLISLRGEGHTAFLRSECVTAQVVDYLVALQRPGVSWCDDEPPPEPPAAAAARAGKRSPLPGRAATRR